MRRRCNPAGAAALALVVLTAAGLAGKADAAGTCPEPLETWTQIDLYFGRDIAGRGVVSERQFRNFLANAVTPRFPDGLTVLDATGQFRDARQGIVREPTKLLVLLVPNRKAAAPKIAALVDRYKSQFRQRSVLRTERQVCLAF